MTMVLDIDQFRPEKGGNPEKVKENQKLRFCNVEAVDKIVEYDNLFELSRMSDLYAPMDQGHAIEQGARHL